MGKSRVKKQTPVKKKVIDWDNGRYGDLMKKAIKKYAEGEMKLEVDRAVEHWDEKKMKKELIQLEKKIVKEVLSGLGRDALRRRLDKKKKNKAGTPLGQKNRNMKLTHVAKKKSHH